MCHPLHRIMHEHFTLNISFSRIGTNEKGNHMSEQSLSQLQTEFYQSIKHKGLSLNTQKNYKTDLECFNGFLKNQKLPPSISNFELPQVLEYGKYLDNRYNSDNSRRRRVQSLRVFFDFLVSKGIYNSNPVRKIPTSPKFVDIPRPTPYSHVTKLWAHLLGNEDRKNELNDLINKRNRIIFLLVYGAGLKVSDLKDLKQGQIILDENPRVLVNHPKRDSYTIPLPRIFKEIYTDYLKALKVQLDKSGMNLQEVLFNANHFRILKGGISPRGLEMIFKELREKINITLTPKSLRQACIFTWLRNDTPESLIKEWLGVSPSYSLQRYLDHLNQHLYNDQFLHEFYLERN